MSDPSLLELEAERERLYAQLAVVGDFRRGSVTENYRRCGKPNCACARPDHPGHGPRFLWTRAIGGRKTKGRQLAAGEVAKVRRELEQYAEFALLSEQIVEANEKICEARPAMTDAPSLPQGEKVGSTPRSRRRRPAAHYPRRRRRLDLEHRHRQVPRGQQPMGNHLRHAAQPDRSLLNSPHPKMILTTYKIGAHPQPGRCGGPGCRAATVAGGSRRPICLRSSDTRCGSRHLQVLVLAVR
jgi:hypothetical protein